MSKSYGVMVSFDEAVKFVRNLDFRDDPLQANIRDRVVNRLEYERDKQIPVKPVLRVRSSREARRLHPPALIIAEQAAA